MKTTQQQIEEKRKELAELEKKLERENSVNRFRFFMPEYKEDFYFICSDGDVKSARACENEYEFRAFELGNMYQTKEQAQKSLEQQKAYMRLVRKIHELNDGWIPDWGNNEQNKYSLYFNHHEGFVSFIRIIYCPSLPDELLFRTEVIDMVIEHCADDFKIWLGVE